MQASYAAEVKEGVKKKITTERANLFNPSLIRKRGRRKVSMCQSEDGKGPVLRLKQSIVKGPAVLRKTRMI